MKAERTCDLLIVGGGVGGCAAALAAASLGRRVVLTEETDWLGGQITAQAVSALDEHARIESFGGTDSYYRFRNGIRDYYRAHYPLTPQARQAKRLNPGNRGYLFHEPRVALAVLEAMFAPHRAARRVEILVEHRAVRAEAGGDRVLAVELADLRHGGSVVVHAPFVIDATELGDLLPLTGTEYVSGAESQADTGEPHAVTGAPQPENVQAFTVSFIVDYL
ncbi:MAG: FAD-dependent oxidoreductase, partial [Planctomycetes bacterium]|nr:FAD-dependent oxidoreductase [Planctomycetota bacterium]